MAMLFISAEDFFQKVRGIQKHSATEEKILAAKRSGIHTIVISEENRKDVEDIKQVYVEGLTFKYVKNIDEVISYIF